jgi:site-specific DNA-methyltransferase (adenine-specific)
MNTFYHGDCKLVMQHDIEPESIDLIYLDPPFFTGKVQKGIAKWQPGAMEVSYEDSKRFWRDKGLASYAPEWLKHIALTRPDFAAYLFYMMERLQLCHKVLKNTGSIYLHCDEKASHYLKMIMDEIFGFENFVNELIWSYQGTGEPLRKFKRKHDTILFYSKSDNYYFNAQETVESISDFSKTKYTEEDENGKFKTIKHPDGKIFKQYLKNNMRMRDVWEIPIINVMAKERKGYPTQKPLALLERIIKASSNEGDTVLDPFCGCGTAIIAAQKLRRNWVGIDINKKAYEVSGNRIGEMPLDFTHFEYVPRDLCEVQSIESGQDFERWVNRFLKADKPSPDRGVDGITKDGIPIQTKIYEIKQKELSQFLNDVKYHPKVKQPVTKIIAVSKVGFDDSARKLQFAAQTKEGIVIDLLTPDMMFMENKSPENPVDILTNHSIGV